MSIPLRASISIMLLAAACGGAAAPVARTTAAPQRRPSDAAPGPRTPSAVSELPAVEVIDVTDGGAKVQLASLVPADRPLLVWFWAPH